jgi:type VI secretion system protein ImpG
MNRDLPSRFRIGGGRIAFELQSGGPIAEIHCLTHPTPTRRPPLKSGTLWRLISHLSLNHVSITGGEDGAAAFAEILRVYDFVRPADDPFPFEGILRVDNRRVVGRISESQAFDRGRGDLPWETDPGFCRGIEVTLELDEERFVGTGCFLFGAVIERFLGLYCSINSFTKLVLRSKQRGEIRRWSPRSGEKVLH